MLIFVLATKNSLAQNDSLKDGYNIIYYKNKKISSEGLIRNGKPDDYWKTYYPTGVIKSEGNRKNFLLDSTWIFYNSYGDTLEKINYLYGKRNGYSYTLNTDRNDKPEYIGNIISKELYVNDKKEGKAYYYFNKGNILKIANYKDNRLDDNTYEFDDKGNIITIYRYNKGILIERDKINRFNENNEKQGQWMEFYKNLNVKSETNYDNGKKNGIFKEYDNDGKITLLLKYDDDKISTNKNIEKDSVDVINKYDNSGRLIFSGTYRDTIPVGIHRFFDKNGNVVNSFIFNEDGKKVAEGIITKEGKKEGKWKYFNDKGNLKSEGNYVNNKRNGRWKYYFNNGKVEQTGDFKNDMNDGVWTWFLDNGEIRKEEYYLNGKEDGESVEYDETGKIIEKGEYIEGEKEGEWYHYINDHKEIGSYVTGLRDGKWKYFYDNDQLEFEGNYVQGNPDGKHRYFYDNGVLKEEQFYSQGIKENHWKKFDKEGNLIITISYDNNKEVRINGEKVNISENENKLIK